MLFFILEAAMRQTRCFRTNFIPCHTRFITDRLGAFHQATITNPFSGVQISQMGRSTPLPVEMIPRDHPHFKIFHEENPIFMKHVSENYFRVKRCRIILINRSFLNPCLVNEHVWYTLYNPFADDSCKSFEPGDFVGKTTYKEDSPWVLISHKHKGSDKQNIMEIAEKMTDSLPHFYLP